MQIPSNTAFQAIRRDIPAAATGVLPAVLVADDDPLVRLGISVMLGEIGLSCRMAEGIGGALGVIDAGFCPDLLITDFEMGGGNGFALADGALQRLPEIKIMIVSGDDRVFGRLPENWFSLAKPFVARELLERIERAFPECAQLIH